MLVQAEPGKSASPVESKALPKPFEFTDVENKAKDLAGKPYVRDEGGMPEFLSKLDNDQYRNIRYKPEKALWRDEHLLFQIQAFHRGYMFKDRVNINIVEKGESNQLAYSPELFDFGSTSFPVPPPADLGFAGLRLHYPLRGDDTSEEIAVFLGASYFRAVGLGQVYGLSARGLAVDTGLQKAEEFPIFREFWIEKPSPDASSLTLYALLDSQSMTGAYRFVIDPGLDLTMDVTCHLFFRKGVERLGIAPLTSMFFHGENTDRFVDDVRPEVHDSDGLLIGRSNGEWIWRPLNNPRQLRISVFKDVKPVGFGLLKRDRNFDHYQDLDASYQLRPSAWVETLGDWGAGAIYLIEIPSDAEKYDNIVAFWVPDQPTGENRQLTYSYRLHFAVNELTVPGGGKVTSTRIGAGSSSGESRQFLVDFLSPSLNLLSDKADVEAEVSASSGKILNVKVQKIDETGGWRLSFELTPDSEQGKDPVELRAMLKSGKEILTETWVYQWNAR
jgi:glucans biosynthesis protein